MDIMGERTIDEKVERVALAALRKIKRVGLQGSGVHYDRTEEGEIAHLALKRIKKLRTKA